MCENLNLFMKITFNSISIPGHSGILHLSFWLKWSYWLEHLLFNTGCSVIELWHFLFLYLIPWYMQTVNTNTLARILPSHKMHCTKSKLSIHPRGMLGRIGNVNNIGCWFNIAHTFTICFCTLLYFWIQVFLRSFIRAFRSTIFTWRTGPFTCLSSLE